MSTTGKIISNSWIIILRYRRLYLFNEIEDILVSRDDWRHDIQTDDIRSGNSVALAASRFR